MHYYFQSNHEFCCDKHSEDRKIRLNIHFRSDDPKKTFLLYVNRANVCSKCIQREKHNKPQTKVCTSKNCMLIDSLAELGEGTFTPTKTLARQWKWNYLLCLGLVRQLHWIDCQKIVQVQIVYIHSFRVHFYSRSFQTSSAFVRSFIHKYIYISLSICIYI